MYDFMVSSILMYAASGDGTEATQEKYIKWILGLTWNTPGYEVKEETNKYQIRIETSRRTLASMLLKNCMEEKINNERRGKIIIQIKTYPGWEAEEDERAGKERIQEKGEKGPAVE